MSVEDKIIMMASSHTDSPPTLPNKTSPSQLRLYGALPQWTAPDVYGSVTKLVLAELCDKLNLQWCQLRLVLHASVNLAELFLVDVLCAGYTDCLGVVLPPLKRLGLKYSHEDCVPFMAKIHVTSIDTLELYSRGYATLDPILNYTSHICATAETVRLTIELEDPDNFERLVPMFTNASSLDARGCGFSSLSVFTEMVRRRALALPRLEVLKFGTSIDREQAQLILNGTFAKGLRVKGGHGVGGGGVNSVLGSWDYFEWGMDTNGIVTQVTTRGRPEYMFRF
ncbi:hypothetical protein B0H13DRAFT_1883480 [Mycena leptocephala]|nr:hypothetical protein B0H13DRAFT_1883480 [Mycena leptocephala]